MILQNSSAIKLQKYCLSLAAVFAIALAVVGRRPSGRGERVQYAVLRVDDVHVLPAGAMVTVYSIVFTALFAIPLGFIFLGADRRD